MARTGFLLALLLALPAHAEPPAHARLAADFLDAWRSRNQARQTVLAARPARDVDYALAVRALHEEGEARAARALAEARRAAGGPEGQGLLRLVAALEAGQGASAEQVLAWAAAERSIADGQPARALVLLERAGPALEGTVQGANILWTRARALHFDGRAPEAVTAFGECARLATAVGWLTRARDAQRARLELADQAQDQALAAAEGLAEVARQLEDESTLLRALEQRAGLRIARGLGKEGRADYLEAAELARRLGQPLVAGKILEKLALAIQVRERQPRTSLRFHEQALELAREARDEPFLRVALFNNAVVRTELAEYDGALALLDELLALAPDLAEARQQRAYVLRRQGRTEKSLAAFARALELTTDPVRRDGLLLEMGELQLVRGDLRDAERRFSDVLGRHSGEVRALAGRAAARALRGDRAAARADFEAAFAASGSPAEKGRLLAQRAVAEYAWGQARMALDCASRALDLFVEVSTAGDETRVEYAGTAAAYALLGNLLLFEQRYEEALVPLGKAAVFYRNLKVPRGAVQAYARWMLLLVALDQPDEALQRLQVLGKIVQGTADDGLKSIAASAEAILEARAGRIEKGRALLREALELARSAADPVREATALAHLALLGEAQRATLARRALEIMDARRVEGAQAWPLLEGEHPGFAPGIGVAALLDDARTDELERARQALYFIESARSARLQLARGGRLALLEARLDEQQLEEFLAVRGRLIEARVESRDLEVAEAAFDAVVERIRDRVPLAFPRPPELEALQAALRPDELLILMLDDPYARASLAVTSERAILRRHEATRPLAVVEELAEGKRKLLVAPDGILGLEATPWREGIALDSFEIHYVNGAEGFLRLRAAVSGSGKGVAAVGGGPARLGPPRDEPPAERTRLLHVASTVRLDLTHPAASGLEVQPGWRADVLVLAGTAIERGARPRVEGVGVVADRCHEAGARWVVLSLLGPPPEAMLDRFYENLLDANLPPGLALREARLRWRREAGEQAPPDWWTVVLWGAP